MRELFEDYQSVSPKPRIDKVYYENALLKKKAFTVAVKKRQAYKKVQRRKYYIQAFVKRKFEVNSRAMKVEIPYGCNMEGLNPRMIRFINELREKYNYVVEQRFAGEGWD